MISPNNPKTITELFTDDEKLQEVLQAAQINELEEHALRGGKLPVEKNGKIEWVLASELLEEQRALKDCRSNTVE